MIHGTRHAYTRGCRCDPCRAANARYQRDYMHGRIPSGKGAPRTRAAVHGNRATSGAIDALDRSTLLSMCWCGTDTVWVDQTEVMACRTVSCGRARCNA